MTLTRNLYELDEVVSALQICLRNKWPSGLFWLWELVVSQEETLAKHVLIESWLYWGGGYDPYVLTEDDWIILYHRIAGAIDAAGDTHFLNVAGKPRHGVTPSASGAAATRRQNRSAAFVASIQEVDASAAAFWISYDSACRQGLRNDAIWLLQAAQSRFRTDTIWSAITHAVRGGERTRDAIALLRKQDTRSIAFQAAATLILCTSTVFREQTQLTPIQTDCSQLQSDWSAWTASVGRRCARLHAIPVEALHKGTTRGQIAFKYTNIGDLRDPISQLVDGCQFWKTATRDCGITMDSETEAIIFPDDTQLELFYDRYFPDDIPDEWSKLDQEKSHGRGCAEKAAEPICIPTLEYSAESWKAAIQVR